MSHSIPAALARCDDEARAAIVASLPPQAVRVLNRHFPEWAHEGQRAPEGDWRTWVVMAGRGFGKTRAGAEWVMGMVRPSPLRLGSGQTSLGMSGTGPHPPTASRRAPPSPARGEGLKVRVALVAASLDEARRVMVEGPSGLLAVARPGEVVDWSFQRRRILFASGAEACLFSGAHPDGLRGPEHDFAWCDELAKWRHPREAWDNLQLGLRRGARPRALVTTTPRRGALNALLGEDGVVVTGGSSGMNPHLPERWVAAQAARLGGGLLKRQELDGELIDEVKGALWTRDGIEAARVSILPELDSGRWLGGAETEGPPATPAGWARHPSTPACGGGPPPRGKLGEDFFTRIVVGVDPPASAMGDACGIVVCGLGEDGVGYVLADASAGGLSPEGWARKVAGAAAAWGAAQVVAEANNGGDMIRSVIRGAEPDLNVKLVHARGHKVARAAEVAAMFEGGRARFAGAFPALEDELVGLSYDQPYQGPGRSGAHRSGTSMGSRSPDRADAMVWALRALMPGSGAAPSVRAL